jgi:endothelin-converting enzyme/putative endopeptidase
MQIRTLKTFAFVVLPLSGVVASAQGYFGPAQTPASKAAPQPSKVGFDVAALDKSVEPCTDFYQFACGGWMKANPIPPDQPAWGRANELDERNQNTLRTILENASTSPKTDPDSKKIGDFYATCMDEQGVEQKGLTPAKPELDRIAALTSASDLFPLAAHLQAIGIDPLFQFGSQEDFKNAKVEMATLDQGGLGLPDREYYLKDDPHSKDLRTKYLAHVTKMFALAGEPAEQAAADARSVMDVETALAKASMDRVARRDPAAIYHKMTRDELAKQTPHLNWNGYFDGVKAPAFDAINVMVPDFFKGLDQAVSSTPVDAWKSYLRWHVLHIDARLLTAAIYNENFDFYGRTLQGQPQPRPRWKRCVQYTDESLGEALGRYYVEETFGTEGKARMLTMVNNLEAALEKDINDLEWMTADTKKQALVKLHAIGNKIGYPDKWRDYSSVQIVRGDLLGNHARAHEFEFARDLRKIGQAVDKSEWLMTPPTLNAYYHPLMNNINFPAGILQPPFFDRANDDAANYGAIGAVIGHELTHGFDDQGRKFDASGNLQDWWTEADGKEFQARAGCVADEYGKFNAVEDAKVNGRLTLGENTADNGGVRIALMALKQAVGDRPKTIDGYSLDQRFFIAYAQVWCQNIRPEYARVLATVDEHSPNKARVNGVVSNMPEFQRAFSCKAGSPMVSDHMCHVW